MIRKNWTLKRLPGDPPRRPLRLLEKPEEISVRLVGSAGWPAACASAGGERQFDVARAEGPERIAMEWWRRSVGESQSDQNKLV